MTPLSENRLQQYFDGELPEAEADAVREAVADDAELRAKLDGLEHLAGILRRGAELRAEDVDSSALFARIEAAIEDEAGAEDGDPMFVLRVPESPEASAPTTALRVVSGGSVLHDARVVPLRRAAGKRERPAKRAEPNQNLGVWMIGGALAAAAAVLLAVLANPNEVTEPTPDPAMIAVAPPPGSEVEEVDFGYSTGAIFSVEGQEGERYAVIWISDEKIEDEEAVQ